MRRLIIALLFSLTLPAYAQSNTPADLQPLPEPPPPPDMVFDSSLEPQITIVKRGEDTVQQYRIGGILYMLKVTPPHGTPYYLVDERGDGQFTRHSLDSGVRVPQWVLFNF
ncbi:MAG: DUF2782 domain-containing protein [Sulfuricellaceae bacterium]